jgi:hypothetical protein
LGGLGGITSGLTQRFSRGEDKTKAGDTAKPKSSPPTGEPAKSGGFANLFNRNKDAKPASESKPLPKPVEGSASLKERFSGGLSGLTFKFSRGKDDKAGGDATKGKNATPATSAGNTTKVNPVYTRQSPSSPSTPAFGSGNGGGGAGNSGFVRAAPKPGTGGNDSRQKTSDPYDFPEDYGLNLNDEEFNDNYDFDDK